MSRDGTGRDRRLTGEKMGEYSLSNVLIRQAWMMAVDGMVNGWCMSSLPYLLT